ncbi:MAG: DUF4091 domain-containing protein [Clostridia bacterium]
MITRQLSSLEKVFPCKEPTYTTCKKLSCMLGEFVNFQIAVFNEVDMKAVIPISVKSDIDVKIYNVKSIPSDMPCYGLRKDDNYLSYEPGLYPDLLEEITDNFELLGNQWHSIWIEVTAPKVAGTYTIEVTIENETASFEIDVINIELPKQELLYTQWFHYDCLSDYYKVPVFSDEHWNLIDKWFENQSKYGANMILTPVLTPPLDTVVGGQRPTVQLVDIEIKNGEYIYSYDKLEKFIKMAQDNGFTHFEIAHPFTQWGAKFAPKVMATVDGQYKRIFGWDTSATGEGYSKFIRHFVTCLKEEFKKLGILENCYFHISDEPTQEHLESYSKAVDVLKDVYADCNVMDALSSFEFYKKGLVPCPIPANNHVEPFIENKVPNLWTYYCCSQNIDVSNRFFSMPSARNRIIATQLYKFDIVGFLHWGYNFYYSQFSLKEINPFRITDACGAFPSGDAFSVYPGDDGKPMPSLRQLVFSDALQDLRAFKLLESLTDKETVMKLIEEENEITFSKYPHDANYILNLRQKVNTLIANNI